MTIYDGYSNWNANEYPAVLAIGDSWFWYPRNNLLEALARHPKLKDGYQHMVRLGENGAMLSEYVDRPGAPGRLSGRLKELLRRDPMQYIAAFMVSGAGNDAVKYSLALEADCTGKTTPGDCISDDGMDALIAALTHDMNDLLFDVQTAFETQHRQPVVFLHGYDYSVPDGRGFKLAAVSKGPWLAPAMDTCKVAPDPELRKGIVRDLIDRVNLAFSAYARAASGVYFIDSRRTLDAGANYRNDWDNELHPTRAGFDRIVDQKWIPVLQQAGIAKP